MYRCRSWCAGSRSTRARRPITARTWKAWPTASSIPACCTTWSSRLSTAATATTSWPAPGALRPSSCSRNRAGVPRGWEDFSRVPVALQTGLDEAECRRLALVENIQRRDLHPLDETEAWLQLLENGAELDDLAARTGLTPRTIKRRLALQNLCDEARALYREGHINLERGAGAVARPARAPARDHRAPAAMGLRARTTRATSSTG